MNNNPYSALEENFFIFHEHFERVGSESTQSLKFSIPFEPKLCPFCNNKFGFFTFRHKCNHCGLSYCSDCIRKHQHSDLCEACYAIENNMVDFGNLMHLLAYKNRNSSSRFKEATAIQAGVLFFVNFLKDRDCDSHEYGIIPLYKLERLFITNPIAQTVQQIIYNHIINCKSCKKMDVLIDLFCDISVTYPTNLKKCNFEDNLLEIFMDPLNLQVTAAASRLILLLVKELSFDPEKPKYINVIASESKMATAFMTAALASKYPIPTIFEEGKSSDFQYDSQYIPQIVENILSLFDRYMNTSLAAQYFGSIILLLISKCDVGCAELVKYLPLHNIIKSLILFCPSQLGLSKNEGKISVYLSRMVKNLWFYCENSKNSDDLLSSFFPSVLGFILDVTEKQCGYDKFSYLCIVQSIALDIVDSIEKHEKLGDALVSPFLQDIFKKMREERQSQNDEMRNERIQFLERQNEEMNQMNQKQLEKIHEFERENQLIKSELLDSQAMISSKDAEIIKLKRQLESLSPSQENINSMNKNQDFMQKGESKISNSNDEELNAKIASKDAEIAKLNLELKEKERNLDKNANELHNCASRIQNLTVKWNRLADLLLQQEDHDSNLEDIVQLPPGF